jgi:citrate lyase subunit beta/citryl-CoA lyase
MMRSLLFVPGDSERKMAKAAGAGADALILDLEDSVSQSRKTDARQTVASFLNAADRSAGTPWLIVRINALDTGMSDDDLAAVIAAAPDAVLLPKQAPVPTSSTSAPGLLSMKRKPGWKTARSRSTR